MFGRLTWEAWHIWAPVVGLAVAATVFVGVLIRVALLPKEKIEREAAMPLDKETPKLYVQENSQKN